MNLIEFYKNPLFYLKYLFKINKKYKVEVNNNSFFVIYRPFWERVNDGKWEPNTFEIFDTFLNTKQSFIDVGAWLGPTTLYGAFKAKSCYAIEPDPIAFSELTKNLNLNPILKKKVKLFDFCLSDKCGEINFGNRNKMGDSNSSILFADSENSLSVASITLQKFIDSYEISDINFIKMDIEGAESFVLPSIKSYLIKNKPTLHLSLHPQYFENIIEDSRRLVKTLEIYKNIYNGNGDLLTLDILTSKYLLKKIGCDIVATDIDWKKK